MKAADLVICRAGATTLAELTAAGRPAILVPLPTATDDHQRKNAEVLARAGAAIVIEERDLTGERLAAAIGGVGRRRRGAAADGRGGAQLARPDAAARIADRVEQLALDSARAGRLTCSVRRGASTSSALAASA